MALRANSQFKIMNRVLFILDFVASLFCFVSQPSESFPDRNIAKTSAKYLQIWQKKIGKLQEQVCLECRVAWLQKYKYKYTNTEYAQTAVLERVGIE